MANNIQYAANANTRALFFILEHHLNFDVKACRCAKPHEVDMNGTIRHWVELQITGENPVATTIHVDLVHTRKKARCTQLFRQLQRIDGNHDRFLLVTIDNTRHTPFTACCTGCPLTCPFARLGGEIQHLSHLNSPQKLSDQPPGVLVTPCFLQSGRIHSPQKGLGQSNKGFNRTGWTPMIHH